MYCFFSIFSSTGVRSRIWGVQTGAQCYRSKLFSCSGATCILDLFQTVLLTFRPQNSSPFAFLDIVPTIEEASNFLRSTAMTSNTVDTDTPFGNLELGWPSNFNSIPFLKWYDRNVQKLKSNNSCRCRRMSHQKFQVAKMTVLTYVSCMDTAYVREIPHPKTAG